MMSRLATLMLCALVFTAAHAQTYPSKTVRWIVPLPPGGSTDLISRMLGQKLSEMWKVPVVAENRPGAAGTIGLALVAKSPPDGYTMALGQTSNMAVAPGLYPKLGYDPLKDLAAVTQVVSTPMLLVAHPSLPAKNVRGLIALAKAKPNAIIYASGGSGGQTHLPMELFAKQAGIRMVLVPYKGVGPSIVALVSGEAAIGLSSVAAVLPQVKAGKLKALAVAAPKRSPLAPDVPTMDESGLAGFAGGTWWGVLAPARTPVSIVDRLAREIGAIVRAPDVVQTFAERGFEPVGNTPGEFRQFIESESKRWLKVAQGAGIKPE